MPQFKIPGLIRRYRPACDQHSCGTIERARSIFRARYFAAPWLQAAAQDTPERVALPRRSAVPVKTFIQNADKICSFAKCSRPKHVVCARLALIYEHKVVQVRQSWPKPVSVARQKRSVFRDLHLNMHRNLPLARRLPNLREAILAPHIGGWSHATSLLRGRRTHT